MNTGVLGKKVALHQALYRQSISPSPDGRLTVGIITSLYQAVDEHNKQRVLDRQFDDEINSL